MQTDRLSVHSYYTSRVYLEIAQIEISYSFLTMIRLWYFTITRCKIIPIPIFI